MQTAQYPGSVDKTIKALEIYDIERPLGTGSMGTVHLLKNRLSGRQYACKFCILPDRADHRLFLEKLRVWIDLPIHPHPCSVLLFPTAFQEIEATPLALIARVGITYFPRPPLSLMKAMKSANAVEIIFEIRNFVFR